MTDPRFPALGLFRFTLLRRWNAFAHASVSAGSTSRRLHFNARAVPQVLLGAFVMWIVWALCRGLLIGLTQISTTPAAEVLPTLAGISGLVTVGMALLGIGFEGHNGFLFQKNLHETRTYPIPPDSVARQTILEKTLFAPTWLILGPYFIAVAHHFGWGRWTGILVAAAITAAVLCATAAGGMILEILLLRFCPPALFSPACVGLAGLGIAVALILVPAFTMGEGAIHRTLTTPLVVKFLPGAAVEFLAKRGWAAFGLFAGQVVGLTGLSLAIVRAILKRGGVRRVEELGAGVSGFSFTDRLPFAVKQVARKPQILIQGLLPALAFVPFFLVPDLLRLALKSSLMWGWLAYMVGLFVLISSVPRLIVHEGNAVWRWFTYPRTVMGNLFRGASGWLVVSVLSALVPFVVGLWTRKAFQAEDVFPLAAMFVGLPLSAVVCVSAAVLGTEPPTAEHPPKLKSPVIGLAIVYCGTTLVAFFLPVQAQIVFFSLFAFFTIGWWVAAELHAPRFLEGADETDIAELSLLGRFGHMFVSPGTTFADVRRVASPATALILLGVVCCAGTLAVDSVVPYSIRDIERTRIEMTLEAEGNPSAAMTTRQREILEARASGYAMLEYTARVYRPFFVEPFKVLFAAGFFFVACLMFGAWTHFRSYASATAYAHLTVSCAKFLVTWAVTILKRPDIREIVKGDYVASNAAFLASKTWPGWILGTMREIDLFTLGFLILAGYGLAVLNRRWSAAFVPFVLWLAYLPATAALRAVFQS